jgi:hypothetical protein
MDKYYVEISVVEKKILTNETVNYFMFVVVE